MIQNFCIDYLHMNIQQSDKEKTVRGSKSQKFQKKTKNTGSTDLYHNHILINV